MEVENVAHASRRGNAAALLPRPATVATQSRADLRLVVVAPNWLGDAIMALPAIADVARARPRWTIAVAARASIAPLYSMVPAVSAVVALPSGEERWRAAARRLRGYSFDAALLLPNSFESALAVWRAGIAERWGYRREWRGPLLTHPVAPLAGGHQAEYYQQLTSALGFPPGDLEPRLALPPDRRQEAARILMDAGWDGKGPLVAVAPGAAYGGAKRWPLESFADLARRLVADGVTVVLVGNAADRDAIGDLEPLAGRHDRVVNLLGKTDLPSLAGVLSHCRGLVSNDSGAMHVGAALGVRVTALFGPTDERATRPLGPTPPILLTHDVWCRPCLLRECPVDHRCMRGIGVGAVLAAVNQTP
jgi:heptosyltransferase-2